MRIPHFENGAASIVARRLLTTAIVLLGMLCCWLPRIQATDLPTGIQDPSGHPRDVQWQYIQAEPGSTKILAALTDEEQAWLQEHPVIRVFQDPAWPPIEFTDASGMALGITSDYLEIIEQRLGIRFERVRGLNWQQAYERMKRLEIDMTTSVAVTPERQAFWAFTKPYMTIPIVIVTRMDVTYVGNLRELEGKKVAVVDGYAITEWLHREYPDIELIKVNTSIRGLELLQRGEVFAFIDNMLVVGYHLAKMKIANLKIAGETPYVNAQCMAVRKDWPMLAGIVQKALDTVGEAERASIYQKWVPIRYEHGFDYRLLWRALAIFTVIVLGLVVWNQKLVKEISERKRAEQALRRGEEQLTLAIEGSGVGLWDWHIQTGEVVYNERWGQMLGYTLDELAPIDKETRPRLTHPEDLEKSDQQLARHLDGTTPNYECEVRMKHKEGRWVWILDRGKVVEWDPEGKPARMTGTHLDITERKHLEAQFLQAQKMESVGRLAGGVAHDFNNMLAVIVGNAELAMELIDPAQALYPYLEEIHKAGQRSIELTRQLLAFARKQTIAPRVLDLNDTVAGMLKLLRRLVGEDIELSWMPGANPWPLKIDPAQLDQILANLCVNARDAIAGVGKVTIETRNITVGQDFCAGHIEFVPGDYVRMAVSDDGCGMGEEVLDHLFEPFYTTKGLGKGTGLGLATVYGIVRQNEGFITVSSEPGQGTTFTIFLPRHTGSALARSQEPPPEIPLGQGQTVLLVEDEGPVLTLGRQMLEKLGYTVLAAGKPTQALALAQTHAGRIALLMTDVVMPEMNGRDLAKRIATFNPGIKILYMSGYTSDVIAHCGVLDQGVLFIQKPFAKYDLALKVREALKPN